jgi:hypothetical protein
MTTLTPSLAAAAPAAPDQSVPQFERQPLAPGESRTLRAAWVHFPDLAVHNVPQEYTRLDGGTGPQRYRYKNLESGWTGELTVDTDGLVVDYGSWRRR